MGPIGALYFSKFGIYHKHICPTVSIEYTKNHSGWIKSWRKKNNVFVDCQTDSQFVLRANTLGVFFNYGVLLRHRCSVPSFPLIRTRPPNHSRSITTLGYHNTTTISICTLNPSSHWEGPCRLLMHCGTLLWRSDSGISKYSVGLLVYRLIPAVYTFSCINYDEMYICVSDSCTWIVRICEFDL